MMETQILTKNKLEVLKSNYDQALREWMQHRAECSACTDQRHSGAVVRCCDLGRYLVDRATEAWVLLRRAQGSIVASAE